MSTLPLSQLLHENISTVGCVVTGLVAAIVVVRMLSGRPNLDAFPTVGSTSWLGSCWEGLKYLTNAEQIIQAGYDKYKDTPFKIATPFKWMVVLNSREHIGELRNVPEAVFSFREGLNDDFNTNHMMEHQGSAFRNPFHEHITRTHLTKNLNVLFPEIFDEMSTTLEEVLELKGNDWKSLPVLKTAQQVICRTSHRVFVGLPLCRNEDYIDLNIRWGANTIPAGILIGFLPKFMRRSAVRYLTTIPACTDRVFNHLRPLIEERKKCLEKYGKEWAEKPNDFLAWLMDVEDEAPELLATRLTIINLGAIHPPSIIFTCAIFILAAHPEYIQPLREEVEGIVEKEGWCKASVDQMHKLDSLLREYMRIRGVGMLNMHRKAMEDYTFSDGLFIPKGTKMACATHQLQLDEAHYPNAAVFDPFRFSKTHEGEEHGAKKQFTTTSYEYQPFGIGKHACPGRFFASCELKTLLAYVLVKYDIKLEGNAPHPPSIGDIRMAHPTAKLMLRKRANLE